MKPDLSNYFYLIQWKTGWQSIASITRGRMSPFASKMEQIKRVLKVPEGSWELQYNFTAKEDVDLAIERSEIERCSIEIAGLDDSQCGSDSDSEFPPDKDKELRGRSDSPSRGNSSSSSSDDGGSDTEIISTG